MLKMNTVGAVEKAVNVGTYSSTAETEIGALVVLDDTAKTFTAVASLSDAQAAEYVVCQYLNADANSVLGNGTNYATVASGEKGRLVYLPSLVGLKESIELGGDVVTEAEYAVGDILVADSTTGLYVAIADATGYATSLVIREIIEDVDFDRYVCEVVIPAEATA